MEECEAGQDWQHVGPCGCETRVRLVRRSVTLSWWCAHVLLGTKAADCPRHLYAAEVGIEIMVNPQEAGWSLARDPRHVDQRGDTIFDGGDQISAHYDFLRGDTITWRAADGACTTGIVLDVDQAGIQVAKVRGGPEWTVVPLRNAWLSLLQLPRVGDIYRRGSLSETVRRVTPLGTRAIVSMGTLGLRACLNRYYPSLKAHGFCSVHDTEPGSSSLEPLREALAQHWPAETGGYIEAAARGLRAAAAWKARAEEQTSRANALADKLTVVERELREKRADYDELLDAQRRKR